MPTSGTLLVEDVDSLISLHHLCMYGHIIYRAKHLRPLFLCKPAKNSFLANIVSCYFPSFELVESQRLGRFTKLRHLCFSGITWLRLLATRDLIELKWDDLLVGDVVYDQYLAARQRATLHYGDIRIARLIFQVICAVDRSLRLMAEVRPDAVLLSHRVGFSSAPLAIAAERMGLPIYSIGGGRFGTMMCSGRRKDYEYRATRLTLGPILALAPEKFESLFESVRKDLQKGAFNADAKLAFKDRLFTERTEFASAYSIDVSRKNVFVMLHAFTDYPHSHFNGMIFKDYFDWFIKTLAHAATNDTVNWIIKEHPASHFYPVTDVDWAAIRARFSVPHIVFLGPDSSFNSMSICHVGDAVVTCLGSAGFEFSAFAGVPSITASDNPYATAGFAICPETREDYFKWLFRLSEMEKLPMEKQQRAKAAFIYIHKLSRVEMSAIPNMGHAEYRDLQFDPGYFDLVEAEITKHEELVEQQLQKYVNDVRRPDFCALRMQPEETVITAGEPAAE